MAELTAAGFDAYFSGRSRLRALPVADAAHQEVLASEQWPEVIELPTGTGKTAVLDTAL